MASWVEIKRRLAAHPLARVGPGLITGVADDDPSGILRVAHPTLRDLVKALLAPSWHGQEFNRYHRVAIERGISPVSSHGDKSLKVLPCW